MQEAQGHGHLVLVPYPLQGHKTPMIQHACILHSKGFSIIIAHAKFNSPSASDQTDFIFLPISETLSCGFSSEASEHYTLHQQCLILSGLQEDYTPLKDSKAHELVPRLQSIRFKDLPASNYPGDITELLNLLENVGKTRASSAVLWNSVDYLEHDSLAQFQQQFQVECFPIGPLHSIALTALTSLLTEDTECITWLEKQATNSVIYVSVGSMATMEQSEVIEMAWGLANSGQPFLWVVRPDLVTGSEWIECLPEISWELFETEDP
ncbi:hypothetical protein ACH5RR_010145 [Cinchona calisaya]|uniref:UDP-glycosyltransferase n=1 Tax=Cinchona calisaya TaxID=153742 RepID=A0ABD3AIK3_9GENT